MEETEEDLDNEIKEMAESYKMEAEQLKNMIGEQDTKQLKRDIVIKKAIDFIVENAVEK